MALNVDKVISKLMEGNREDVARLGHSWDVFSSARCQGRQERQPGGAHHQGAVPEGQGGAAGAAVVAGAGGAAEDRG